MSGFAIIVVLIWLGAVAAWWFLTRVLRTADIEKMRNRLLGTQPRKKGKGEPSKPALFESEPVGKGPIVQRLLKKYDLMERTQALIEQAGLKWHVARFVHGCMAGFILAYLLAWVFLPPSFRPWALLVAAAGGVLPLMYVVRLRKRRLRAFEEIFPDSLEFISRSMRAGHAFSVSLEMIYREFQEPLAGEFRRTFEEHNLGLPLDVSLQKLSTRVPLLDVQFFVSAVLLQKRTGGNLAEILDKLAYVIRERFKLRGKIRAVSAHGRMTGIALTCIPIVVAILMFFTNPDYVKFFFLDETGNIMAGVAVALQLLGYLCIKKIVAIEV
ncbi:MAG: type II secretion system F family protein [Acidobacteria bacterium]|nr:type II secretion system F family protein [Acidobacteriota bacterium]MBI3278392.1 type II secretion system F family protein [Acidobacteriota bacterium]